MPSHPKIRFKVITVGYQKWWQICWWHLTTMKNATKIKIVTNIRKSSSTPYLEWMFWLVFSVKSFKISMNFYSFNQIVRRTTIWPSLKVLSQGSPDQHSVGDLRWVNDLEPIRSEYMQTMRSRDPSSFGSTEMRTFPLIGFLVLAFFPFFLPFFDFFFLPGSSYNFGTRRAGFHKSLTFTSDWP